MTLSIVIPMLNEAEQLHELLSHLGSFAIDGVEVVLVDGGSGDGSRNIAEAAGFTVVESTPGRARQMNLGAARTTGEQLLFLHADSRLPEGAIDEIEQALRTHFWGRFDVIIRGRAPMLPVIATLMNARSRLTGIATGDQGIFMTRTAFQQVAGFPEQPLMEDIDICRALKHLGKPANLRLKITTSGRRWEERGVWRTIVLMWWLRFSYWLGTPVEQIARRYR